MWVIVAAVAALAIGVAACGGDDEEGGGGGAASDGEAAQETEQVKLLMNWFAQAEQGGYWQAQAAEIGADEGVEITVDQGGPQIQTIPQVAAGQAEFGVAQADELLLARAEGVPVVEVFGGFDQYLQCMMFHPSAGISDWPDLDGHQIAVAPSGGFWPYLKGEYNLDDVQEVNFTGDLATFARNENLVQQCFITSEPYVAEQEGIPHETLLVADGGYNPYTNGLFTTEDMIEENPELVRNVVAAVQEGWATYLEDPTAGNELIMEVNGDMEQDKLDFAHDEISSGGWFADPIGSMTAERWQTLHDQLQETGVLTKEVDPADVWTDEFMP